MRIAICGSSSVGKTTLIEGLREDLEENGYKVITEISRTIKRNLNLPINNDQAGDYDQTQLLILGAHLNNLSNQKMITDRCIIDCFAYTEHLSLNNKIKISTRDAVANSLESGLKYYDLIFYLPVEFASTPDGTRTDDEDYRKSIDKIIRDYIGEVRVGRGVDFIHEITGSPEERIELAKHFIKNKVS